jgi:SAM-dependent methyltransferase
MYAFLNDINRRPNPFQYYTAETLWNGDHISKQMLAMHLDESGDPASRNQVFLDQSAAWMTTRFGIGPKMRICDFGCGPGLYTSRFAALGADVTGIDFSERSIGYAQKSARQKGLSVDYLLQNYLTYASDRKFDLITLIYCDLCPLSPEQRKILLDIFCRHLADDGHILLDVFSMPAYAKREETATYAHNLMDGFWSPVSYYGYLNTFKYDRESVVLDKYTIVEEARTFEVYNWLQYYSRDSLGAAFAASGLRIVEHYDDVAGAPYTGKADEIAIVACKM